MNRETNVLRKEIVERVLEKQDDSYRWGYNKKQRPEYLYYSPNFKSTLWTLILLADIKAPVDNLQIQSSLKLITQHFFDTKNGIFGFADKSHFPIPCLNGNMIYLHHYFKTNNSEIIDKTISFFSSYQRFDDGSFRTPKSYPYCSNKSCYGKHTCYWGITKLLKGISFIPREKRDKQAQTLLENCIDFILHHEVCFRSHHREELLHRDIGILTFPNFYKSDFLEILWLLSREKVQDRRMNRSLDLLHSKRKDNGWWVLEKAVNNIIVTIGKKDCANAFITVRGNEVLG